MNLKIGVFAIVAGLVGAVLFSQSQRPAAMPELNGAVGWLNSGPLTAKSLRGKVVLVNFWTYTCINSLRPMPYVKSWAAKYKDSGLVVFGVHTPEFSFEHERPNVEWATRTFDIVFPVAIDSDYYVWQAFYNEAWPAQYIVDGKGEIRYRHYGEGEYVEMERVIQKLLKENSAANVAEDIVSVSGAGAEAAPSNDQRTPETYVGYRQAENFTSPEKVARDSRRTYSSPAAPSLNQWGLVGSWNVGSEAAVLQAVPGKIVFRFHARDLNLIMAPAKDGKPVRFKITLDGAASGDNNGVDTGADGNGEIREPRMYQLIRQKRFPIIDHTFEIEFLDPGAQVLDVTFG
jgi:thiol-disulfide isomerase/thioredoxin